MRLHSVLVLSLDHILSLAYYFLFWSFLAKHDLFYRERPIIAIFAARLVNNAEFAKSDFFFKNVTSDDLA